jgi:hypothetical protein
MLHRGTETRGIKGSTGDSLFTLETEFSIVPKAAGTFGETGRQKAVITRADTILVYHLEGDGYDLSQRPLAFTLHPTYPNPFNQGTTIHFTTSQIGGPTVMRLSVHNILGRRVRSLGEQTYAQGDYQLHWDGRDDQGKPVPSGVYFVMLRSGDDVQATKMMLLK